MKIKIDDVLIGERIRKSGENLESLMQSIRQVGLLHPIFITPDRRLISGFRRLQACRQLGWTEIDALVIDSTGDAVKELDLEFQENLGRRDLTEEDLQKYEAMRAELLKPPKRQTGFWEWLKRVFMKICHLFKKNKE